MIDGLLATLERNAQAEIARIEAEGRARAAAIADAAERRMQGRRKGTLGVREAAGRAALERALAAARHGARQRVLEARAALLERVFAAIRGSLRDVAAGPAYQTRVAHELDRARAFTAERSTVIRCAPQLAARLRQLVRTNGSISVEPDGEISGGFRLVTQDGVLEVDATLEGRLDRARPRIAMAALAALPAAR